MNMSQTSTSKKRRRKRSSKSEATPEVQPLDQIGTPLDLENSIDTTLLRCVDIGFAFLIVCVPFLMGGREGPGQLALVATACWIAGCWGVLQVRQRTSRWTLSLAEPLLAAGIALVLLQLVHLPTDRLQSLSPKLAELLTSWQGNGAMPTWDQLTLMPAETLDGLMVLVAYVLIFVVALQRIRTQNDIYRLMMTLSVAVVAMAAFGLLQYATSNGKFFWFYENPHTDTERVVKGAFTNRNHFANFLALGIGPLLWCLTSASVRSRAKTAQKNVGFSNQTDFSLWLVVVALSVVAFANLLSLSRGGAIAMGVACVVCGIVLYRSSVVSGQLALAGICAMVLTCGLIAFYGEEQIQKRLDQIASADIEQLDSHDGRREIWAANWAGIKDFPIVGTGVGTHREVYPMYMESSGADHHKQFTHAENGYLQVCLETGAAGLGMLLIAFLFAIAWTFRGLGGGTARRPMIAAAQAASLAGILASLAHSGADFVWYVPACVVPVILLAASACRMGQLLKEEHGRSPAIIPLPRLAWTFAAVGVVAIAIWMVPAKYRRMQAQHHWYAYLRMSTGEGAPITLNSSNALRNKLVAVSRTIKADPSLAAPHAKMANLCLIAFQELQNATDNPMSLAMIGEAARVNEWDNREHLDEWLGRILGERQGYLKRALVHAQESLELCPLQGEVYLRLAELDLMDADTKWDNGDLVQQAITVRPHEPKVMFASAEQKLMSGKLTEGIDLLQRAFKLSRRQQTAIINALAPLFQAPVVVSTFEPDAEALAQMSDRYRELGRWPDMFYSLRGFTNAVFKMADDPDVETERKIRFLLAARKACDELRDPKAAELCFSKAIEIDPRDYRVYYQRGVWLAEREQFGRASEEFRICSELRPGDDRVRRLSLSLRKKELNLQLQGGTQMATPGFLRYQ